MMLGNLDKAMNDTTIEDFLAEGLINDRNLVIGHLLSPSVVQSMITAVSRLNVSAVPKQASRFEVQPRLVNIK
jgi:hypothetical protein